MDASCPTDSSVRCDQAIDIERAQSGEKAGDSAVKRRFRRGRRDRQEIALDGGGGKFGAPQQKYF
jgi:hypothetical protein